MDVFSCSHDTPQVGISPLTPLIYQNMIPKVKIVAEDRCWERGYQTITFNKSDLESFAESLIISHRPIHISREEKRNLTGRDFKIDCKTTTEKKIQTEFVKDLSGKIEVGINPRMPNIRAVVSATNGSTRKHNETVTTTDHRHETEGANTCLTTDVIAEPVVVPCTLKIHKDVKIAVTVIVGNNKTVGTVVGTVTGTVTGGAAGVGVGTGIGAGIGAIVGTGVLPVVGTAVGAGIGAGIGALVGVIPGLTIGGTGGGTIGGVSGYFAGKKVKKTNAFFITAEEVFQKIGPVEDDGRYLRVIMEVNYCWPQRIVTRKLAQ